MRTKLGYVLTFLGVFLIVVAVLAGTYAKSSLKKTPIDADSLTNLSGNAILNGPDGFEQFPVLAFSTTRADSDKSDGDVVVFKYSSCVVRDEGGISGCVSSDDPESRLLTASTDNFAADRVTALAVNGPKYLPASATPHEGLLNKWPFDAEKKTYPYWDGTTEQAVDAVFSRTTEIDGHELYVYTVDIENAPIEVAEGVSGFYSDSEEITIEPRTGAFVNVQRKVAQTNEDGSPILNLKLDYTDDEVKDSLDSAVDSADKLDLLTKTVPLIGYIGGGLCLIAGLVLLLSTRRRQAEVGGARRAEPTETVSVT